MVSMTHKMTWVDQKIKSVKLQEQVSLQNTNKLILFYFIATKPIHIVFEKMIDNINKVNQKYVTP